MRSWPLDFPGFSSPAIDPVEPFEILQACHERTQRSLNLLHKLLAYLVKNGHDESAAQAAKEVSRFFNIAAPLHHQDEELHVFPALIALRDRRVSTLVIQLLADHQAMEEAWRAAAQVLEHVASHSSPVWQALSKAQTDDVCKFAVLYDQHMMLEEKIAFPHAQAVLTREALRTMSVDMVARRQVREDSKSRNLKR